MYVRCRSSIESSLSIVIKSVECEESTPSVLTERFMNLTLLCPDQILIFSVFTGYITSKISFIANS